MPCKVHDRIAESHRYWCPSVQSAGKRFATVKTRWDHALCSALFFIHFVISPISWSSRIDSINTLRRACHYCERWRWGCRRRYFYRHIAVKWLFNLLGPKPDIDVTVSYASKHHIDVFTSFLWKGSAQVHRLWSKTTGALWRNKTFQWSTLMLPKTCRWYIGLLWIRFIIARSVEKVSALWYSFQGLLDTMNMYSIFVLVALLAIDPP